MAADESKKAKKGTGTPLDGVLSEIVRTFKAKCYHAAIAMALTIPDICVTLESSEQRSGYEPYKRWMIRYYEGADDDTLATVFYKLRCGVSHNAFLTHADLPKMRLSRVVFTVPESDGGISDLMIKIGDEEASPIFWEASSFCQKMIDAALLWYSQCAGNETVKANMERLIRLRPEGLPPYVSGLVLA